MPTPSPKKPTREQEHRLVVRLRTLGAHAVRVMNGDDEREIVAVPERRKKWSAVVDAIEAGPWTSCVALNKAGQTLGHIANDAAATDVVDLSAQLPTGAAGELRLAERIVHMVMQAQERTLKHRDAELTTILQAQGQSTQLMSAAVSDLAAVWREQREAANEAAEARLAAQAADAEAAVMAQGGDMQQLMQALPALLQLLPMLKGLASGGASSPNGTPH